MIYNKGHFYLIWVIFGMICIFSINQFIELFGELLIVGGITINIRPKLLEYLKPIVYVSCSIFLIIASIRILKQKSTEKYLPDYKKLRKYILIILGLGIISKVSQYFLMQYRIEIFSEYLNNNNIEYGDIYQSLFIYPSVFWYFMFLYLTVLFFILTKKTEKITNANNGYN